MLLILIVLGAGGGVLGRLLNLVEPGFIQDGGMATATSDARLEQVIAATPLARAGTSEDVAGLVSYLASDSASFITGQVIQADGGLSL